MKTRHARPDEDTTQPNTTVVIRAAYWQPRGLGVRVRVRASKKTRVVASAYSPQKRHGPATATDSGGSLQASVTSGYSKEELIKESKGCTNIGNRESVTAVINQIKVKVQSRSSADENSRRTNPPISDFTCSAG